MTDVFDGSFRWRDFEAPAPQLAKIEGSFTADDWLSQETNGHENLVATEIGNGDGSHQISPPNEPGLPDYRLRSKPVTVQTGSSWLFLVLAVVSAKSLYSRAVDKANELLTRWKNDPPNFEPIPLPHEVSVYATRNKRPGMEDRHVVIPDLRAVVDLKVSRSER